MDEKGILKLLEKEFAAEKDIYGNPFELLFQSYELDAVAMKLTEHFYKIVGLMGSDSEEATEDLLVNDLLDMAKFCITAIAAMGIEAVDGESQEEDEDKPRTIGFKVADKADTPKEETEEDTEDEEKETEEIPEGKKRAIGFKVADREDGYKDNDDPEYEVDTDAVSYQDYYVDDYYDEDEEEEDDWYDE